MDFSKLLSKKEEKQEHEYYWALIVEPFWVQAGIWRIEGENAQVMYSGNSVAWEMDSDLPQASDTALSAAIQNFPENLPEPSKTVFGVISSWVEEGQIKEEYLEKIKVICKELSLKPVGFVVVSEAIANLIKSEEGSPVNAIILGVFKENLEVSVFQMGSLLGNTKVARSISVTDDIAEGLSRFSEAVNLPSRFIIYDGREGELEEVRQILFKVNWEDYKDLKFLHTPKVEIIESSQKMKAISLAGASEMAAVKKVEDISVAGTMEIPVSSENQNLTGEQEDTSLPQDEGFIPEDMLAADQNISIEQNNEDMNVPEEVLPAGHDIENITPAVITDFQKKPEPITKKTFPKLKTPFKLSGLTQVIKKIKFPKLGFVSKFFKTGKTPFIVGFSTLIILLIGGFLSWWFLAKATITIYVSPRTLFENLEVNISEEVESSELKSSTLKAKYKTTDAAGSKTTSTTGIKTVGDKATGQVMIYRAGSQISLPSGTVIKGSGNLQFVIDTAVTLASGSASSPGTTKVNVSAADIGAQYNLASGSSFSVGNFSTADLEAKNESSFSGGSSREVNVVSEEDQQKLEEDLSAELISDAKKEIAENASPDEYVLEESLKTLIKSKDFDSKVGDEASDVKIDLSLEIKILVVNDDDLKNLSFEYLNSKVPQGFVLKKENIKPEFETKGEEEGISKFRLNLEANLLPDVNTEEIRDRILGRYPQVAITYLEKTVPGYVNTEIKTNFLPPGKLSSLPRVKKNLDVIVAAQK